MLVLKTVVIGVAALGALGLGGCFWGSEEAPCAGMDPCGFGGANVGSSTSGAGGMAPACFGDPTLDPAIVRDDCFVFASAGAAPGGNGTKALPFASVQAALDSTWAYGTGVITCADQEFAEEVVVFQGAKLYGGFDCSSWGWKPDARTTISPAPGKVPLRLTGGTTGLWTELRGLRAVARDAVDPGQSSIAAIFDRGQDKLDVVVTHCDFAAGNGAPGAKGTTPVATGADGEAGNPGGAGCAGALSTPGGALKANLCGADFSQGGSGGVGTASLGNGGDGSPGKQAPLAPEPAGKNGAGGKGEGAMSCVAGSEGAPGDAGAPGLGAAGSGQIDATGYLGIAGSAGGSGGKPGQGGGGGGGAKAGHCAGQPTFAGPGGGGGGSGGCGGPPGGGGGPGGASIGLLSFQASLTLTHVKITSSAGGSGGDGGDGHAGALGGNGGPTAGDTPFACVGGTGGKGGVGGPGGGGLGGYSIALALVGGFPYSHEEGGTPAVLAAGVAGAGGPGGNLDLNKNRGAAGIASPCWRFNLNKPCTP